MTTTPDLINSNQGAPVVPTSRLFRPDSWIACRLRIRSEQAGRADCFRPRNEAARRADAGGAGGSRPLHLSRGYSQAHDGVAGASARGRARGTPSHLALSAPDAAI